MLLPGLVKFREATFTKLYASNMVASPARVILSEAVQSLEELK
jgi:hypothetical protein